MCEWSPNGQYLASVAINGEILIWSTSTTKTLDRFKHPNGQRITSIAWNNQGNEIAWAGTLALSIDGVCLSGD